MDVRRAVHGPFGSHDIDAVVDRLVLLEVRAWKRIFAVLHGKTAQRASKLCSRVQNPKRLDSYREVTMALERWEVDGRDLERTTGNDMADLTKL